MPKELRKPQEEEGRGRKGPKLEAKFKPPELAPPPSAIPARIVYTGAFGSSAPATVVAPIQKVQTGGFGDPNGLKGQGKDNAHLTSAKLGSFDLPEGQGTATEPAERKGSRARSPAQVSETESRRLTIEITPRHVQTAGFGSQELAHNGPKIAQADTDPQRRKSKLFPNLTQFTRRKPGSSSSKEKFCWRCFLARTGRCM